MPLTKAFGSKVERSLPKEMSHAVFTSSPDLAIYSGDDHEVVALLFELQATGIVELGNGFSFFVRNGLDLTDFLS
jgi:hypothetical protein